MAAYVLACTFDQVRWQPHFVINPVVLLIVTAREPEREVLRAARLAIASVYFFAGLGKLNVLYAVNVHDSMMSGVVSHLPAAFAPLFSVPWVTPIAEMAIGLAVLMPGRWATRRFVLGAAVAMHAFILVMLLSVGVDFTVVPFNVSLAVLSFSVLFDRDEPAAALSTQLVRTASGKVAILFGVVAPVLSLIGVLDMYQSHAYYAGSEPRVRWFASPAATERLRSAAWPGRMGQRMFRQDAPVPAGAKPLPPAMHEVPLAAWMQRAFGQDPVREPRVSAALKDQLCAFAAAAPDDIVVRYYGPAHPITGSRAYRDANCSESLGFWLRFGGWKPIVIGGDRLVETLDQSDDPRF